ncbi:DEAD-box ATP-dependent RNA helicase 52C [Sesamum angolense]|uniref:RNA helicase n=1 Tax=Sesamum angolense TaxID=2727404 RepID=A0AAE1X2W2_9LAMI|nr:DEAD-box ATP-dependent RNA helicase 52C [Sesamum angolense]
MSRPWFSDSRTRSTLQTLPNRSSFVPRISKKTDGLLGFTSRGEEREYQESHKTNSVAAAYDDVPVEATGRDIPPHVTSFEEMGFSTNALTDNIRRCKYVKPTPIQSYAIPVAMAGRDLMACAQTGSGKTAAFCFPIINSVMDMQRKKMFVNHSAASGIACPVALILAPTRELSCQIHEVAKNFSYQTGVKVVVAYGGAPAVQQRLASDFLSNYIFLAAGKVGSSSDLIVQRVEFVPDVDKRDHLVNLLRPGKTNTTPSEERERALRLFRSGRTPILVATDVAARGLDIPHVAHVINFDLPRAVDDYVHRIGRTGRAGKSGLATAFFSEKNAPLAKALVELMQETNQEIPEWLNKYAKTTYTGGGSGRSSGHGCSKFGGYDYRSGADCKNSNDFRSQHVDKALPPYAVTSSSSISAYNDCNASTSDPIAYNLPYAADTSTPTAGSHGLGPYNHLYNGTVVATGWE